MKPYDNKVKELPYTGPGKIINSDFLDNIDIEKAKEKVINKLEEINCGNKEN